MDLRHPPLAKTLAVALLCVVTVAMVQAPIVQAKKKEQTKVMDIAPEADQSVETSPSDSNKTADSAKTALLFQAPAVDLTLEDALLMALENNPGLHASQAQSKLARAKYLTSLAKVLPDVELNYTDQKFNGTLNAFGTIRDVEYQTRQPQVVVKFPIFKGGRNLLQIRAAKKLSKAGESLLAKDEEAVLQNTANTYFELQHLLEVYDYSEKNFSESQQQLELNKSRVEAGVGTQLDVLQSEAQLAQAKQQLIAASGSVKKAANALNEILDLPVMALTRPKDKANTHYEILPKGQPVEYYLEKTYAARKELAALEQQLSAKQSERAMALTVILPDINVEYRTGGLGPRLDNLGGFDDTRLGMTFAFPNLAGTAFTLYKEKSAEIEGLKAQIEQLKNRIEREVMNAYLDVDTQQASVEAAAAEVTASEQAVFHAQERLSAGIGRNIDLLDAQTRLAAARSHLAQASAAYHQAQVNLVYATGYASVKTLTLGLESP